MSKIQIVGKMVDGKAVILQDAINKRVEPDDVLLNEDGEYLRVLSDGNRLQTAILPEVTKLPQVMQEQEDNYADTIASFLAGTGRM